MYNKVYDISQKKKMQVYGGGVAQRSNISTKHKKCLKVYTINSAVVILGIGSKSGIQESFLCLYVLLFEYVTMGTSDFCH